MKWGRAAPLSKRERCDAPPESSPFAGDVSRRQECPLRPASTCWPHAARSISRVHPPPHDRVPIEALLAEASAATPSIKAERDGLAAAARQAMLCRATRRSSNSKKNRPRQAPAARVDLHRTLATSRETIHPTNRSGTPSALVPPSDPFAEVTSNEPRRRAAAECRDPEPRAAARPEPLFVVSGAPETGRARGNQDRAMRPLGRPRPPAPQWWRRPAHRTHPHKRTARQRAKRRPTPALESRPPWRPRTQELFWVLAWNLTRFI